MRLRVDDFFVEFHDLLKGILTLAIKGLKIAPQQRRPRPRPRKRKIQNPTQQEESLFPIESVFNDDPIDCDNWRGLIKNKKKQHQKTL